MVNARCEPIDNYSNREDKHAPKDRFGSGYRSGVKIPFEPGEEYDLVLEEREQRIQVIFE